MGVKHWCSDTLEESILSDPSLVVFTVILEGKIPNRHRKTFLFLIGDGLSYLTPLTIYYNILYFKIRI